jgi:hypothetical protein
MPLVECHAAIARLSSYIAEPRSEGVDLDAALAHVRDCLDCRHRIGYLVRALNTDAIDRLNCPDCQVRLPEFVAAAEQSSKKWRAVALHLVLCPSCAGAYADLADMIDLAHGRRGVEPPIYPTPNLSFLKPERPWELKGLALVIKFSAELLRALRLPDQPAVAASGLKSGAPAVAASGLKSGAPAMYGRYILAGEVPDENVTIAIEPMHGDPAHRTIVVQVDIPSRGGWPNLGGTLVSLRRGDIELGDQATDGFGNAVFERIAEGDLARLVFAIERADSA